jgi:hypothetical protein
VIDILAIVSIACICLYPLVSNSSARIAQRS